MDIYTFRLTIFHVHWFKHYYFYFLSFDIFRIFWRHKFILTVSCNLWCTIKSRRDFTLYGERVYRAYIKTSWSRLFSKPKNPTNVYISCTERHRTCGLGRHGPIAPLQNTAVTSMLNMPWIFCYASHGFVNKQQSKMTSTFLNCTLCCVVLWFEDAVTSITHSLATYIYIRYVSVNINYRFGTLAIFEYVTVWQQSKEFCVQCSSVFVSVHLFVRCNRKCTLSIYRMIYQWVARIAHCLPLLSAESFKVVACQVQFIERKSILCQRSYDNCLSSCSWPTLADKWSWCFCHASNKSFLNFIHSTH